MIYPVHGTPGKQSRQVEGRCRKPEIGRLIVPYELRMLEPEEEMTFEIHLLECDSCFERLKALDAVVDVLAQHSEKAAG